MSKNLEKLIISSIKRNSNNTASATTRPQEIDVNTLSDKTKQQLTELFSGSGLKSGNFEGDPAPSRFKELVSNACTLDVDTLFPTFTNFATMTKSIAELLARTLNIRQAQQAKDGFLITYVYTHEISAEEDNSYYYPYLATAYFHRIEGVDINDVDLAFEEIERINLEKLTLGARISLDLLQEEGDDTRPITFKVGGRTEISQFFLRFLGCTEPENTVEDTRRLREAIEAFAKDNNYDINGIAALCERAKVFCKDRVKEADGKITISDLATSIFMQEDHAESFVTYAHDNFRLSDSFIVSNSEVNKFSSLYIKTPKFTLQFKTDALNSDVDWNAEDRTLTFSKLPESAINQILQYLPNDDSDDEINEDEG